MSDTREAEADWAYTYYGYKRLASKPRFLEVVVDVARDEYRRTGRVPPWFGVDLLRGRAFTLHRVGHSSSHDAYDPERVDVLQAVRDHPGDLPPVLSGADQSAPGGRGHRRHRFPRLSSDDVPEGDDRE